jgi:hypothetical protein
MVIMDSIVNVFNCKRPLPLSNFSSSSFRQASGCLLKKLPLLAGLVGGLFSTSLLAASATPAFVQGNYVDPQTPQASVTVPFSAVQTAGDLNVVVVAWGDTTAAITSVTDSMGKPYLLAVGPTKYSTSLTQSIYYAKNIASATAGQNVVSVKFSSAAVYPEIRIMEYSGLDLTTPLDVTATTFGSGTTSSSGSLATTSACEIGRRRQTCFCLTLTVLPTSWLLPITSPITPADPAPVSRCGCSVTPTATSSKTVRSPRLVLTAPPPLLAALAVGSCKWPLSAPPALLVRFQ